MSTFYLWKKNDFNLENCIFSLSIKENDLIEECAFTNIYNSELRKQTNGYIHSHNINPTDFYFILKCDLPYKIKNYTIKFYKYENSDYTLVQTIQGDINIIQSEIHYDFSGLYDNIMYKPSGKSYKCIYFEVIGEVESEPITQPINIICDSENITFNPNTYNNGTETTININANSGYYFTNIPILKYVSDSDNFSQNFNKINDTEYSITINETFNNVSNNIIIDNVNVEKIPGNNFYRIYIPSDEEINVLSNELLVSTTDSIKDLSEYITSYFKIFVNTVSINKEVIRLGGYNTSVSSNVLINNRVTFNIGNFNINGFFNNNLDYNSKIELVLPFTNNIELNSKIVMNKTINIKCVIDYLNYSITYYIYCNDVLIDYINGVCGYRLPYKYNMNSILTEPSNFIVSDKIIINIYYNDLLNDVNIYNCDKYSTIENELGFITIDNNYNIPLLNTETETQLLKTVLQNGIYK